VTRADVAPGFVPRIGPGQIITCPSTSVTDSRRATIQDRRLPFGARLTLLCGG
jgi:hypothetical protein